MLGEIYNTQYVHESDPNKFRQKIDAMVSSATDQGLDVEILFSTAGITRHDLNGIIYHSAIIISRKSYAPN